mmetsp:Transcript_15000/g.28232  ORF Transcript_15000/g.28232 Transcript_15000/m.28232 type:complete len:809 (-) Transcript_15000:162-2588(-)
MANMIIIEELYEKLNQHYNTQLTWSNPILCQGCSASNIARTQMTDIRPLLRTTAASFPGGHSRTSFQFDRSLFQGTSKETIIALKSHIFNACREAGFYLAVAGAGKPSSKNQVYFILFQCDHNRVDRFNPNHYGDGKMQKMGTKIQTDHGYKKQKNTNGTARKTYSASSPIDGGKCRFRLRVYCSAIDETWYLSRCECVEDDVDPGAHNGHIAMPPEYIRTPLYMLLEDKDSLQLLHQCKQHLATDPFVTAILRERTQLQSIKPKQMQYLMSKLRAQELLTNNINNLSSAERLLKQFDDLVEGNEEINYVALIHSFDQGYKLRVPKGRPSKECAGFSSMNIDNIRESMKIKEGQDILLAFAWTTKKEAEMAHKFPEIFMMDVTEKTNIEKRGTFVVTGIDGNNKIFIALHCFMPNGFMETYDWIYDYAFPLLVGEHVIEHNEIVVTDGEYALYDPLVNLSHVNSPWQGTKHVLCEYHLLEQEWIKTILPTAKDSVAAEYCEKYKSWIVSWFKEFYTECQFEHSYTDFECHLASSKETIGASCFNAIYDLWSKLKVKRFKWATPYKRDKMHLGIISSSMVEAINGDMKAITKKPLASMALSDSSCVMLYHSNNLEKKRERHNAEQLNKIALWSASPTKLHLTNYAEGLLVHNFDEAASQYMYIRLSETVWYVAQNDYKMSKHPKDNTFHAKYTNVFQVNMNERTKQHLSCSCDEYVAYGIPCVHMLCVTTRISHEMCQVRWLKLFNSFMYVTDTKFQKLLEDLRQTQRKSRGWCYCPGIISEYTGQVEYYKGATLDDLRNFKLLVICMK